MSRRLPQAAAVIVVAFAAAQFIRSAVNLSEWASYPPDVQRTLLSVSCQDATSGKMPGPCTLVRPGTKLSPQDIETICAAARQAELVAAGSR
jgi:hypothetical protein